LLLSSIRPPSRSTLFPYTTLFRSFSEESAMHPDAWIQNQTETLETQWREEARWSGIERTYTAADVVRLRGSVVPEHTIARLGAEDRKSTRLNSSHQIISYAVFCLK